MSTLKIACGCVFYVLLMLAAGFVFTIGASAFVLPNTFQWYPIPWFSTNNSRKNILFGCCVVCVAHIVGWIAGSGTAAFIVMTVCIIAKIGGVFDYVETWIRSIKGGVDDS